MGSGTCRLSMAECTLLTSPNPYIPHQTLQNNKTQPYPYNPKSPIHYSLRTPPHSTVHLHHPCNPILTRNFHTHFYTSLTHQYHHPNPSNTPLIPLQQQPQSPKSTQVFLHSRNEEFPKRKKSTKTSELVLVLSLQYLQLVTSIQMHRKKFCGMGPAIENALQSNTQTAQCSQAHIKRYKKLCL